MAKAEKPKKVCPVTRAQFEASAQPMGIRAGDMDVIAQPRVFKTGSFGWYVSGKVLVDVGGTAVPVQIQVNAIAIGSKPVA